MGSGVTAVIMVGGGGCTPVEQLVARAREAITRDTVDKLLQLASVEHIIVATDSPALLAMLADRPVTVEIDPPGEVFHFGRRLLRILAEHHVERCLYIGGGSGPLLGTDEWGYIAASLVNSENTVITNNFYSTDFAAWTPAKALERAILPDNDNQLTWTLRFDAGLSAQSLPRSATTQLDVDTPIDLMTLSLHPGCGSHLRQYLDALKAETDPDITEFAGSELLLDGSADGIRDSIQKLEKTLTQVLDVLLDRTAEIFIAGRVSTAASAYLQTEALCRKRILAEERSMRASGRQDRGEVSSLLGVILEDRDPRGFFDALSRMGQALILDSRVILAHRRSWPSARDRFYSDLRQPSGIEDAFLREFTRAAVEAPVPVILGGHSLVSGGLWALVDAAWARAGEDIARRSSTIEETVETGSLSTESGPVTNDPAG